MYTVAGPAAADGEVLLGNYSGLSDKMTSILSGITSRVSATTTIYYAASCQYDRGPDAPPMQLQMESVQAAAVIAVMGISPLFEGEEGDAIANVDAGDRLDCSLPTAQISMLAALKKIGRPLVLILTGGSPIISPEIYAMADAVLWAWYPGQEGGHGVADVLFGDVSPSGRLPITFPRSIKDLPAYDNYAMEGRTYRYSRAEPLYPFGFGLSYTRFRYSRLRVSKKRIKAGETITAEVAVTNSGQREGDEVVQLYVRRSQGRPVVALRDFRRVKIAAGQTAKVSFQITPEMLGTFDDRGEPICPTGRLDLIISGAAPVERSVALGSAKPAVAEVTIV